MSYFFRRLSYYLSEHPLMTNIFLSTVVGFYGDVICQSIYEPWTKTRPSITHDSLPTESSQSRFLIQIPSIPMYLRSKYYKYVGSIGDVQHDTKPEPVLLDLRRSMIFSSFAFIFGVRYSLMIFRVLDRLIPPKNISKKAALGKGFLNWIFSQFINPIFLIHVSLLNHFFIYRDGRDGRRQLNEMPRSKLAEGWYNIEQGGSVVYKMGHYYCLTDDKSFNIEEYMKCVLLDMKKCFAKDFIDITRYGLVFWGLNWLPLFYYIPCHFRIAYASCAQLIWSGIMSFIFYRG
ncbi:unnamed protein product [Phytomonas sp. EM1]|nr:unnamed protein product [Phytomonas sp. EM1]|eukprot:CCW63047.1 unnamed protein product [Phytomonas sp. isolate EM1]